MWLAKVAMISPGGISNIKNQISRLHIKDENGIVQSRFAQSWLITEIFDFCIVILRFAF